jgi:hypothetical protein
MRVYVRLCIDKRRRFLDVTTYLMNNTQQQTSTLTSIMEGFLFSDINCLPHTPPTIYTRAENLKFPLLSTLNVNKIKQNKTIGHSVVTNATTQSSIGYVLGWDRISLSTYKI